MNSSPTRRPRFVQWLRARAYQALSAISPSLTFQIMKRVSKNCCENWRYRTKQVLACPDNAYIKRVPEAGEIHGDFQIMHNGLKVLLGSYYGKDSALLLKKNRGVHEPQEERIFQEVLRQIPPGSAMIELGAYWGYYSMWFCKEVPNARAYLVEPVKENLEFGRKNFAVNGLTFAAFTQAWVGEKSGVADDGQPVIGVDDFVAAQKLEHIAILHSDIQGFELEMLKGARKNLSAGRISYCFVSTHTVELHAACEKFLREQGFEIFASISPPESYSVDGILVGRWPSAAAVPPMSISRRPQ